jgi:predicted MFS family arabinose efflux permease
MQKRAPSPTASSHPLWVVVLSAGLIVGVAMGLRQVMGLYLPPVTKELGIGREPFSEAMALANLIWGLGAVIAGAIADRHGAGRVVVGGTIATMVGLAVMCWAGSAMALMVSGVLLGIGVSGTGLSALVGAVGRAAAPATRTRAIAALGMASGIGGFLAFPYAHVLMEWLGWRESLLVLMATSALITPLAFLFAGPAEAAGGVEDTQTLAQALSEAFCHPSYLLLLTGFFVCGFHVAFYGVHLPAFVADRGLDSSIAVAALTLVGLANLAGTYIAGSSGRFMAKRRGLSLIYFLRCFVFLGLLFLPITPAIVLLLSTLLGFLWLSTVPLTSSLVAVFFGTRWLTLLFGVVFLSHQMGSFAGLWMAGYFYDMTKSYDAMWWISIALGMFAAFVHWPIKERGVARLLAAG